MGQKQWLEKNTKTSPSPAIMRESVAKPCPTGNVVIPARAKSGGRYPENKERLARGSWFKDKGSRIKAQG